MEVMAVFVKFIFLTTDLSLLEPLKLESVRLILGSMSELLEGY